MKARLQKLFLLLILLTICPVITKGQSCGFSQNYSGNPNPHTFIGGWYKPSRSDIGGAPSVNYFPVLIVFVQFKNESGDSTTTNFES